VLAARDVARYEAVCAIERRFGAFELRGPPKSGHSHQSPAKGDEGMIMLSQIREMCGAEVVKKAGGYEGLGVRVAFWDTGIRDDHVDLLTRPITVLGPKWWFDVNHGTQIASILCGEGRGDPRARGPLPLGGWCSQRMEATPFTKTGTAWWNGSFAGSTRWSCPVPPATGAARTTSSIRMVIRSRATTWCWNTTC